MKYSPFLSIYLHSSLAALAEAVMLCCRAKRVCNVKEEAIQLGILRHVTTSRVGEVSLWLWLTVCELENWLVIVSFTINNSDFPVRYCKRLQEDTGESWPEAIRVSKSWVFGVPVSPVVDLELSCHGGHGTSGYSNAINHPKFWWLESHPLIYGDEGGMVQMTFLYKH